MMLQQSKNPTDTTALVLFTGGHLSDENQRPLWIYKDHHGNLQGPFSAANMLQWFTTQRLPDNLQVCGITQQTAAVPLNAIPPKFFQPLGNLIASTAAGARYSPLSIAKAPSQPALVVPQQGIPQNGSQMPIPHTARYVLNDQMPIQASAVGAAGAIGQPNSGGLGGPTVSGTGNIGAAQLHAAPLVMRGGSVQTAPKVVQLASLPQQQQGQQPRLVVVQQPQQLQQQPQMVQLLTTQAQPQVVNAGRPAVLLQQAPAQPARVQQLPGGQIVVQRATQQQQPQVQQAIMMQHASSAASQTVQQATPGTVVLAAQPAHVSGVGGTGQMTASAAQYSLQGQGQAAHAPLVPSSLAPDMLVGQQLIERQLQQAQQARSKAHQWAPVPVTAQTRQYPGAEAVQQRLQATAGPRVAVADGAHSALSSQQGSAAVTMRDLVQLALPGQHAHVPGESTTAGPAPPSGPRSVGGISPVPALQQPRSTATVSAANSVSSTPRQGPGASLPTGSSFSSLQQLAQQAAGAANVPKLAQSSADAVRRSSAPGDVAIVAGTTVSAVIGKAAVLHRASLLSMAEGAEDALKVSTTPQHSGISWEAASIPEETQAVVGQVIGETADAVIDDLLFGLVEDVAQDAGEGRRNTPEPGAAVAASAAPSVPAAGVASAAASVSPAAIMSRDPAIQLKSQTAGPRAVEFLHQQQLLQQQRLMQQAQGQPAMQLGASVPAVLGGGTAAQKPLATSGAALLQNVPLGLGALPMTQGVELQRQQQPLQHQLLVAQEQQLLAQQQQRLLAQAQQQQHQKLLAQAQAQQQQLLVQAQAKQQQQQQLLLVQQRLQLQQQQLAQQQNMRDQLAQLQQQQQLQQLAGTQQQQQQAQTSGLAAARITSADNLQRHLLLQEANKRLQSQADTNQAQLGGSQQAAGPSSTSAVMARPASVAISDGLQVAMAPSGPSSVGGTATAAPAAEAADSTKLFNPFGMSFIDPQLVKEQPQQHPQQSSATTTAVVPAVQQASSAPPPKTDGTSSSKQLTDEQEREIMAALMPELAAMGMTTDQQLSVLKQMLGLKEQQQKQAQQQHTAASAEPLQASKVSAPSAQPAAAPSPQPTAPPAAQPQHVWLQQLAAGKTGASPAPKPADSNSSAAQQGTSAAGGTAAPAAARQRQSTDAGSDGDEFDLSMLPSDLFDFMDVHSHKKGLLSLPGDDVIEGAIPASETWSSHLQQQQQASPAAGAAGDKPAKYVPPSLRRSPGPGASSSTGNSSWPADGQQRSSYTGGQAASSSGMSSGAYQPPHARERAITPPPGFEGHSGSAASSSRHREVGAGTQPFSQQTGPAAAGLEHMLQHSHAAGIENHNGLDAPAAPDGRSNLKRLLEHARVAAEGQHASTAAVHMHQQPDESYSSYSHTPAGFSEPADEYEVSELPHQQRQRVPPKYEASGSSSGWGSGYEQQHYEDSWAREGEEGEQYEGWGRDMGAPGDYDGPAERWNDRSYPNPAHGGWPEQQGDQEYQYQHDRGYGHEREAGVSGRRGRGRGRGRGRVMGRHGGDREGGYGDEPEHVVDHRYLPQGRSNHVPQGQQLQAVSGRGRGHAGYVEEYPEESSRYAANTAAGWQGKRRKDSNLDPAEDASLTWQQQQLLGERSAISGGPKGRITVSIDHEEVEEPLRSNRSGRSVGADMWGEPPRERQRSPTYGRRAASHDHPAPQPSQHLRQAAQNPRSRQAASIAAQADHPRAAAQHSKPYADFLKQLDAGGEARRGGRHQQHQHSDQHMDDYYEDWSAGQEEPPAGKSGVPKEAVASAAAAALAAVQGLKPFCTAPPPRSGKGSGGKKGSGASAISPSSRGPQLPGVEETKAAVLAALGPGPSRTTSMGSDSRSVVETQEYTAVYRSVGPEDREGSLTGGGSGPSDAGGPPKHSAGSGSLFSSVIGQLRKQASGSGARGEEMEPSEVAGSPSDPDQATSSALRAHAASYATAVTRIPTAASSTHSAPSSSRRAGGAPADIVLAAIQTTRQRAHGSQRPKGARSRQGGDGGRAGKADAAWREADTTLAWDSNLDA